VSDVSTGDNARMSISGPPAMAFLALAVLALASASSAAASSVSAADVAGGRARASTARLSPAPLSSLPPALRAYLSSLHAAMRGSSPAPGASAQTAQDCMAYALAYERALTLQPWRAPARDVWDALRLGPDCGAPPPPSAAALGVPAPWPRRAASSSAAGGSAEAAGPTFFVDYAAGDDGADGSATRPFKTVLRGVAATRAARPPGGGPAAVLLRAGVHVLGATVALDARDAGLTVAAAPGEAAWVSGGAPLRALPWAAVNVSNATGANVWRARVAAPPPFMTGLLTVAADGAPAKRLFRAQFPNFNPEMHATGACGGGARAAAMPECVALAAGSPFLRHLGGRLAAAGGDAWAAAGGARGVRDPAVLAWTKPANFSRPEVFFHNLSGLGLKNDSAMVAYNMYGAGRGGACGLWTDAWPRNSSYGWSYHCGNVTAGGWEEVDELMQTIGQLNLPNGLMFDVNALPNMAAWKLNVNRSQRVNGAAVVNVWMTQNWFNNAFYVTGQRVNATAAVLDMVADDGHYPSGGWQGGRHWQTQCSFDGCGPGGALLGGGWWVSNVAAELDAYDEFFFDPATNDLTLFFNASDSAAGDPFGPPPADLVLMAPQLEIFFDLSGATDVTLDGLGFRDQREVMLERWLVPSGGDWGLRPFGAVQLFNTTRCTVSNALFLRTDGNAIFVGGRSRNASVLDSEFAWLGMNAVASLGTTQQDDATGGDQPFGTLLSGLVARELALYEKQSSAYFLGRTPLSRVEACVFFNGPRAMINVNDHLGGGNNFTTSVLFNTCRESGDHGAMNSCVAGARAAARRALVRDAARPDARHFLLSFSAARALLLRAHYAQVGPHAIPTQHCVGRRRRLVRARAQ
jgi:hypothetical protein